MEILSLDKTFEVKSGDILLVQSKISLPQLAGKSKEARRINAHYARQAHFWERYVRKTFAKEAKKQYDFMEKNGYIFNPYEMNISFEVTLNNDSVLSLYTDRYEYTGGANGVTVRNGDTWAGGFPMRIKAMESKKRSIRREITEEIKRRQASGESYVEPVKRYVREYYNPEYWYLVPNGITVFFQETTIAPHSSGIVTFLLEDKEGAP